MEYWTFSPGLLCLECGSVDRIVAGYESVVRDILAQMPADACDDNAGLTENFLAHQLPNLTGAVVMPVAVFVLIF